MYKRTYVLVTYVHNVLYKLILYIFYKGTGVNRKDTEKVTEKDTEKDTERDTEQPKSASRASELVSILAPRRTPKDGCRFRCILCAVGRVKADGRGPKVCVCTLELQY